MVTIRREWRRSSILPHHGGVKRETLSKRFCRRQCRRPGRASRARLNCRRLQARPRRTRGTAGAGATRSWRMPRAAVAAGRPARVVRSPQLHWSCDADPASAALPRRTIRT